MLEDAEQLLNGSDPVILRELLSRQLCRKNLLYFIRQFYPKYQAGWVHKLICDKLTEFATRVLREEAPRLMIAMPPRAGKSLISSQFFPAWFLGNFPSYSFITCSYALSLQLGFSRKVRSLLQSSRFKATFPQCELSADAQNVEGWQTTSEGGLKPAGRGGPIGGFGCNVLVLDDLIKNSQEAASAAIRDTAWDWYTSTARTRLAPGAGILAVGTRWHYDDPMGRLEAGNDEFGDKFEVLRFPAIATEDEEFRKRGEALHPERYSLKALRAIQASVGPAVWEALYQQNPVPETGGYFDLQYFKYYDTAPKSLRTFASFDLAIGKKERNDYTVGVVAGLDDNDQLYILDVVQARLDSLQIVDLIFDLHTRYKTFLVGVENGQLGMAINPLLQARCVRERVYDLAIEKLMPGRADKEARARTLQGMLRQGRVWFKKDAEWLPDIRQEMIQFPHGKHDDQVDAMAYAALMSLNIPPPRPVEEDKPPEWITRLDRPHFSNTSTFMSA